MSWVRNGDTFTDDRVFEDVDYPARWHYLALVQWCCRNALWDGRVRLVDARRVSDVPDPDHALDQLVKVGLLDEETAAYRVLRIDEHIPPPSMRDENRKPAQRDRKRRSRARQESPDAPVTRDDSTPVTSDVTRDTGTGRDGTGQDGGSPEQSGQEGEGSRTNVCAHCGRESTFQLVRGLCRRCGGGPR